MYNNISLLLAMLILLFGRVVITQSQETNSTQCCQCYQSTSLDDEEEEFEGQQEEYCQKEFQNIDVQVDCGSPYHGDVKICYEYIRSKEEIVIGRLYAYNKTLLQIEQQEQPELVFDEEYQPVGSNQFNETETLFALLNDEKKSDGSEWLFTYDKLLEETRNLNSNLHSQMRYQVGSNRKQRQHVCQSGSIWPVGEHYYSECDNELSEIIHYCSQDKWYQEKSNDFYWKKTQKTHYGDYDDNTRRGYSFYDQYGYSTTTLKSYKGYIQERICSTIPKRNFFSSCYVGHTPCNIESSIEDIALVLEVSRVTKPPLCQMLNRQIHCDHENHWSGRNNVFEGSQTSQSFSDAGNQRTVHHVDQSECYDSVNNDHSSRKDYSRFHLGLSITKEDYLIHLNDSLCRQPQQNNCNSETHTITETEEQNENVFAQEEEFFLEQPRGEFEEMLQKLKLSENENLVRSNKRMNVMNFNGKRSCESNHHPALPKTMETYIQGNYVHLSGTGLEYISYLPTEECCRGVYCDFQWLRFKTHHTNLCKDYPLYHGETNSYYPRLTSPYFLNQPWIWVVGDSVNPPETLPSGEELTGLFVLKDTSLMLEHSNNNAHIFDSHDNNIIQTWYVGLNLTKLQEYGVDLCHFHTKLSIGFLIDLGPDCNTSVPNYQQANISLSFSYDCNLLSYVNCQMESVCRQKHIDTSFQLTELYQNSNSKTLKIVVGQNSVIHGPTTLHGTVNLCYRDIYDGNQHDDDHQHENDYWGSNNFGEAQLWQLVEQQQQPDREEFQDVLEYSRHHKESRSQKQLDFLEKFQITLVELCSSRSFPKHHNHHESHETQSCVILYKRHNNKRYHQNYEFEWVKMNSFCMETSKGSNHHQPCVQYEFEFKNYPLFDISQTRLIVNWKYIYENPLKDILSDGFQTYAHHLSHNPYDHNSNQCLDPHNEETSCSSDDDDNNNHHHHHHHHDDEICEFCRSCLNRPFHHLHQCEHASSNSLFEEYQQDCLDDLVFSPRLLLNYSCSSQAYVDFSGYQRYHQGWVGSPASYFFLFKEGLEDLWQCRRFAECLYILNRREQRFVHNSDHHHHHLTTLQQGFVSQPEYIMLQDDNDRNLIDLQQQQQPITQDFDGGELLNQNALEAIIASFSELQQSDPNDGQIHEFQEFGNHRRPNRSNRDDDDDDDLSCKECEQFLRERYHTCYIGEEHQESQCYVSTCNTECKDGICVHKHSGLRSFYWIYIIFVFICSILIAYSAHHTRKDKNI